MAARTTIRTPMPIKIRAKQFAMFDAMKGLTEAIAEKEQYVCPKRELTEDRIKEIDDTLRNLQIGDHIEVCYYCQYGKIYRRVVGELKKIDCYWREIFVENTGVSFSEIECIEKLGL